MLVKPNDVLVALKSFVRWAVGLPTLCVFVLLTMIIAPLSKRWLRPLLKTFARVMCVISGMKLRCHGLDNVDPEQMYVLVFNHTNIFDHFALYTSLPFDCRGVEKESHFSWPVHGWFLKAIGQIPIAPRGDTKKALASLESAKEAFKKGMCIAIAPEGTRSPDGKLLPFKKGAFHMAVQLQAPILPIVFCGMYKFNKKNSWIIRPGNVDLFFEKPIPTQAFNEKDVNTLRDETRALMLARLRSCGQS